MTRRVHPRDLLESVVFTALAWLVAVLADFSWTWIVFAVMVTALALDGVLRGNRPDETERRLNRRLDYALAIVLLVIVLADWGAHAWSFKALVSMLAITVVLSLPYRLVRRPRRDER